MESYKTLIKNSRTLLIGHVLIYAQGIILMPIIIKTAGAAVYGGYVLLVTLLGFIFGISSFGVGFKCGRFLPSAQSKDSRREIFFPQFWFQLVSVLAVASLFVTLCPYFEMFLLKDGLTFYKWLVFPFLLSNFFYSQAAAYFISTHRMKHFNYATVAYPYLNILLVMLAIYTGHRLSVNMLIATQIAAYTLIALPLVVLMLGEIGLEFPMPVMKELLEDMRLGFPLRLNYVADVALGSSDRYLLVYFISVAAVGCYNPAYALGSMVLFFPKVSSVVLAPLLSKAVDAGNMNEACNMMNYTIKGFLLLAIPFIAGAAVLGGPLLKLLANVEVAQAAYLVTPVIAAATLFLGLNIILSNALWVKMKTTVMFRMNVLAVGISIILNLVFLRSYRDIIIAAFSALISYAAVFAYIRSAVSSIWPLDFGLPVILKSIAASVIMFMFLSVASVWLGGRRYEIWFLLLGTFSGAAVYVSTLFALGAFSDKELIYLKSVFGGRAARLAN